MPAPQATLMKQAARAKFASFNLKVPENFQQPQGQDGDHYGQAFKPEEKSTSPGVSVPPLFTAHTMNKYHTDVQKMLTSKFGNFIDKTCEAICSTWSNWQSMATMSGVVVNAVTASLGVIAGPPWTPLILKDGAKANPSELKYTQVIANVLGTAWQTYTATIKVPGMPWYPLFAMVTSPVAPPTANVPTPIAALTQVTAALMPMTLKNQMVAQLGDPKAMYHKELFEAICDAFDKMFKAWQLSTMVTNVMGTGPVPTFAPPYVPGGPVVGGVATMPPGGLK
jgi:hypothetical protein